MPSVTLGRKRPSDAIIQDGTKSKKIKFTDDGQAVAVSSSTLAASTSKVKPDYSKVTNKAAKQKKSREETVDNATATANATRTSLLAAEQIDFPRGGGTSLTALELKEARTEGLKDAESQIFKVRIAILSFLRISDQAIHLCRRTMNPLSLQPLENDRETAE